LDSVQHENDRLFSCMPAKQYKISMEV
jgi:hypothetical protein